MTISSLKKELDNDLTECQKEAVRIEITLLEEKTSRLLEEIAGVKHDIMDALNSRNDILYNSLHETKTKLYTQLIKLQ